MKKKPPPEARAKASNKTVNKHRTRSLPPPQELCDINEVPPKYLSIDHVPSTDDVAALWLALARQGIILPLPPGLVILPAGRA